MAPANVVLKLRTQEANDTFFRELAELCRAVAGACCDPALARLADSLLVPVEAETGVRLGRGALAAACAAAIDAMHEVVDHDTEVGTGRVQSVEELENGDEPGSSSEDFGGEVAPGLGVLQRMYAFNEDYAGKIRPDRLKEAFGAVSGTASCFNMPSFLILSFAQIDALWTFSLF